MNPQSRGRAESPLKTVRFAGLENTARRQARFAALFPVNGEFIQPVLDFYGGGKGPENGALGFG